MQVDYRNSGTHYWITALWCAFGAIILGAIAVISYWIRKCRINNWSVANTPSSDTTGQQLQHQHHQHQHHHHHHHHQNHHHHHNHQQISNGNNQQQQQGDNRILQPLQQQQQQLQQQQKQLREKEVFYQPLQAHALQCNLPHAPLSVPITAAAVPTSNPPSTQSNPKSVSILVYKTLNTVFKSSRKIIFRVCEVASAKKSFTMFKFNQRAKSSDTTSTANCTGHDRFCQARPANKKKKDYKKKKSNGLRRSNSAIEFDASTLTAASRRQLFSRNRSASSEQDNSDQSEHSEKSPLVSARLDNLAKLFFSKSMPADTGSRDTIESVLTTRPNLKYQYSALDSGTGVTDRSPRERASRDRALNACREWVQNSNGRYDVIAHLDEIGSRHSKNWFLINDSSVRTDRLMTLLPLPPDCVALDELPPCESPKGILMELLGSLHHPYIYPVLDLGFLHTSSINYACLVTPFNSRGSLKDLIYKAQWNEPWNRKYTRKPNGLPATQVQRLGRQILEALLFLKERGFPLHGHLHSGNVILQNGAARLSGLENGLLGLSSRINAIMWSRSTTDIENVDIICFGHLLYEMCTGQEMTTPKPSMRVLEMDLEQYPQILEILGLIFDPPDGQCPSVEELVFCDLFRNIDLRELRGPCFSTIKPSLSRSTLNLLLAVKKRQTASLGSSFSETSSPCTPPSTPRDRRAGRTMDSFDISSDSEEGLLDEIVVTTNSSFQHRYRQQHQHYYHQQHRSHPQYDPLSFPSHFSEHNLSSDDNGGLINGTSVSAINISNTATTATATGTAAGGGVTVPVPVPGSVCPDGSSSSECSTASTSRGSGGVGAGEYAHEEITESSTSGQVSLGTATTSFNHQLTADMCSFKNSKSRRLEYSLKCLKYGRSNPSQDSAFGSLTDGDLSIGSSSFRLSSFQSITSPIDEGVEDIIIATTTAGNETCLELATVSTNGQSNDSAISTPCREGSPNFLAIEENSFTTATSSSNTNTSTNTNASSNNSNGNGNNSNRPQQFPVTLSPKIHITTSASTSNLQFDPPKILVNDQNSIYTTSPSKRSGTIEVFSQKYRVCSFEDMSPSRKQSKHHLKNANRMAFRSLEEERRIDSAFIPIQNRTNSENRVNINNSEKYKKLTHSSFSRISKTTSNVTVAVEPPQSSTSPSGSGQQRESRHTLWRDSKFYRKNRIAKSNDSLLESPNHSPSPCRLSPSSLRDNHYEATSPLSSSSSSSFTRHGLNRGNSVNEISYNSAGSTIRRYCSSKSEDLGDLGLPIPIDSRKSHSERHLFSLSKLRQTAITNTGGDCFSEDESFHHDDNKSLKSLSTCSINRVTLTTTTTTTRTKKKTTSMAILPSGPPLPSAARNSVFKSLDHALNYIDSNGDDEDVSSSTEESPRRHFTDIARIFGSTTTRAADDPHSSSCSEEKTPLLDSVEMSPISPTEPNLNM